MADMRIDLKKLGEIGQNLEDKDALKKIYSYLYQLSEQLRYFQNHIEPENLTQKANEEYELLLKRSRLTLEATEELILKVQHIAETPPDGIENNSIRIDNNGIQLTAGEINMLSGLLKLIANDPESLIQFGTAENSPNLIIGQGGDVNARSGAFREGLTVGDQDITELIAQVIEQQKSSGSGLDYQIVVSETQPEGDRILWFQPEAVVPSGGTETTCTYRDEARRSIPCVSTNLINTYWFPMTRQDAAIGSQDGCKLRFRTALYVGNGSANNCYLSVMVRYTENGQQVTKGIYSQSWTDTILTPGTSISIDKEITLTSDPTDNQTIEYGMSFNSTGSENTSDATLYTYGNTSAVVTAESAGGGGQEETHVANCQVKYIWKEEATS